MINNKLPYIPALDGMRAISILLVVVAHFGLGHVVPGGLGVTIFFFISGFIITRMLVHELSESRTLNLKTFYLRRFFRLGPALMVFILVCILSALPWKPIPAEDSLASLFYLANYWGIFHGFSGFNPPNNIYSSLAVLWSLAVEEHFYFLFPLLILGFKNHFLKFLKLIVILCAIILLWRFVLVSWQLAEFGHIVEVRLYKSTDTRVDSILYGCVLSVWHHIAQRSPQSHAAQWMARLSGPSALVIGLGLLLASVLYRNPVFRETLRYSIQGVGMLLIFIPTFLGIDPLKSQRWLSSRPMVYIGNISYSLYLYHWLVFVVFMNFALTRQPLVLMVGGFVSSTILAHLSYRCVETPLRRFGRRWAERLR